MLLKRRNPANWRELLRISLWPRRSWFRSGQYVTKRILRLTATPHAIAAGVAVGVFTSFQPFMGFHFCIAFVLAWLIRGNLLAAALGTFVGNPISFPFIWAASYSAGHSILQTGSAQHDAAAEIGAAMSSVASAIWNLDGAAAALSFAEIWDPLVYPMMIGGAVIGVIAAIPFYFLTLRAAKMFRESRRNRLMKIALDLREQAKIQNNAKGADKVLSS